MGFIKICGMTDARAVSAAMAAGADAIGFVFAPSVRKLTPAQAVELARPARGRVLCVAVTQHPSGELLEEILHTFQPDALQTDYGDLAGHLLPPGVATWPVIRGTPAAETASAPPPADWRGARQAMCADRPRDRRRRRPPCRRTRCRA